jgi:hypothetical protein
MTEFEKALQDCLQDVEQGNSNIDECLLRYPQFAQQLEPVLLTSAYLQRGREARPSAAFKARVRTKLIQGMYARPRRRPQSKFMFTRLAVGFAAVLLALLVSGTAYAQSALPGNAFYDWKLVSENIWRAVSPDPIGTDLAIAERRLNELIAVYPDPTLYSQTLKAYLDVVDRLKSEVNVESEARILEALDSQVEELNQAGVVLPPVDQNILPPNEPTQTPTTVPLPVLETPQVNPTDVPEILPTIKVPSQIVPTIQDPSQPVPTIEVPSGIVPTVQDPPKIIPTIEIPPPIP